MLSLIDQAASKEDEKVSKKLAKKASVAKIIEEKDAKKDKKQEEKKEKLEQVKQAYLEAQKKKKGEARKQKGKARAEAARQKNMPAVSSSDLCFKVVNTGTNLDFFVNRHLRRNELDLHNRTSIVNNKITIIIFYLEQ
jgi:FKBP-type peptidyl-prolyl cis-trans isomerase